MGDQVFVPADAAVPGGRAAGEFRLEPPGPRRTAAGYAARAASIGPIQAAPGSAGAGWPREMSRAEKPRGLERPAQDFAGRRGFPSAVPSTSTGEVTGCGPICPPRSAGPGGASAGDQHAAVGSWVGADHAGPGPVFCHAARAWLDCDWPFPSVQDAPRV
jgi:hypothetical protein